MNLIPLEGSFRGSTIGDLGIISLVAVPILLLIAIILALAKKKRAAKKVLIAAGICGLIGVGLCGLFWSN